TTPAQRLAIASRVAAVSVLTNRYLINPDLDRPSEREGVLDLAQLLGSHNEKAEGLDVPVDKGSASEALETGVFGERVEGLQTWRHQSYAEYLAARYLSKAGLAKSQLVALLTDGFRDSPRIVPQLEETACWLVDMVPGLFHRLAPASAEVFIRCDPANLSSDLLAVLVSNYLDSIRKHETPEVDWSLKPRFARLAHPALAGQISPIILDRSEQPLVHEAAIEIANYCKCV